MLAPAQHRHEVVAILLDLGAEVNGMTKEVHPKTALQYAASVGSVVYVLSLLEHGADPDYPKVYELSPVWAATNNGNLKCKFLVKMARHHGNSYVQRKDVVTV